MGYSELTIAGLLGHASGSVTGRYAHVADFALLMAADAISEVIYRALAGEDMEAYVQARTRLGRPDFTSEFPKVVGNKGNKGNDFDL